MERLVEGKQPKAYTPSGGTLLLYFKMKGKVDLPVHRFLMPNDLEPLMTNIFKKDDYLNIRQSICSIRVGLTVV